MKDFLVYLDTDISLGTPGAEIDDGAALFMLLGSPRVTLGGIGSVFGNAPVEDVDANLARLLQMLKRTDIPLATGAGAPLQGDLGWFADWQAGYGPTPPCAHVKPAKTSSQLLIELARAHPGQVIVLAIGPLTNLALALESSPEIAGLVKAVIAMGGSFNSREAEFNMRCDPAAAQMVLQAGWPLTLLGLEITRRIAFSRAEFAALAESNPAIRLFKEQAAGWIKRVETMGWEKDGCALHDAAAAACLLRPELFSEQPARVTVSDGRDLPEGATVLEPARAGDGQNLSVITQARVAECRKLIWSFIERL